MRETDLNLSALLQGGELVLPDLVPESDEASGELLYTAKHY